MPHLKYIIRPLEAPDLLQEESGKRSVALNFCSVQHVFVVSRHLAHIRKISQQIFMVCVSADNY